jgi:hypothetical protein
MPEGYRGAVTGAAVEVDPFDTQFLTGLFPLIVEEPFSEAGAGSHAVRMPEEVRIGQRAGQLFDNRDIFGQQRYELGLLLLGMRAAASLLTFLQIENTE